MIPSIFGVVLFGSLFGGLLQRPSPFIDRKVADQYVLRPDWTEIKLDKPLEPIGDYQEIGLILADPFKMDLLGPLGIQVSDGSLVLPEVELVTPDGITVELECSGSRGEQFLTYRLKDESKKRDYVRIRIRADRELPLDAIFWTGIIIKNRR